LRQTTNMTGRDHIPRIYVLAGPNGAGKSSLGGAMFRESGAEYFNPDEVALRFRMTNPGMTREEANSAAWRQGKRLLECAISERLDFAFETTLGGRTIAGLLHQALSQKIEVRIWYVGLATPELHIARVRSRVAAGGHDIPEAKIRERYENSRLNFVNLMPKLTELRVYDNSEEGDPRKGIAPRPMLLLHMDRGKIVDMCDLTKVPQWAKPILMLAITLSATK
jgi:predicted ABC-type ATPase